MGQSQEKHLFKDLNQPHTNTLALSFVNHSLTHCTGQIVCDLEFAEEESGLLSADLLLSVCRAAAASASFLDCTEAPIVVFDPERDWINRREARPNDNTAVSKGFI